MLLRGGPGAGKSVLAADTAMRLARALGGDVLYVCVEILPREVLAQRMGFDGFDPGTAIDLAQLDAKKPSGAGSMLVVGMTEMEMCSTEEGDVPDVGRMILDLARISMERGCDPRVVVVDSLSGGYRLGADVPRPTVDGVCKLAVEQGWALVLVEEAADERESPWSFAVDTVLSLQVTPAGRREVRVTKHRFGSSQPGPHRLFIEREGVRVIPCFDAYRNAVRDLALPPPAKNRSLRVQVVGQPLDRMCVDISDGDGGVENVHTPRVTVAGDVVDRFTAALGATTQDGFTQSGSLVTLWLSETHGWPLERDIAGFRVSTLHPMIDGEEWLEAAFSCLAASEMPLARVRVGPTSRLNPYEHRESLKKAISLFATILSQRGIVIVLVGMDLDDAVIRAGIVTGRWTVQQVDNLPPGCLKVTRECGDQKFEVVAVVSAGHSLLA
jgi:KaiC/GvpD/RAD55 family RecA-like ATPase